MTLMVSTMESVAEGRGGLELGPLALVQRVAKYLRRLLVRAPLRSRPSRRHVLDRL